MAQFSGTSFLGRQNLAVATLTSRFYVGVDFPQLDLQNAGERIGLLLVCQQADEINPRVVEDFKLFGGGLLVLPRYPLFPLSYQIIVDWYRPQLAWFLDWTATGT